jgi:rhamnose transport system permease protein
MIAMSASVMAVLYRAGVNFGLAVLACMVVGILAGYINGTIITKLKIPAIVVTLTTLIFYRGIAYALLQDSVVYGFPEKFGFLGGTYKPLYFPIQLIIFLFLAIVIGILLHFTKLGRELYAIGNNEMTCRFTGIQVDKIRLWLYVFNGFLSGFVGLMMASRLGMVRPDIASLYELKAVTIVVLGGVAIFGGRGSIIGVVLSAFLIGYINYGLKLVNVQEQVITIVTGLILIIALIIPRVVQLIGQKLKKPEILET